MQGRWDWPRRLWVLWEGSHGCQDTPALLFHRCPAEPHPSHPGHWAELLCPGDTQHGRVAGGAGLCTRGTGPCRDTAPASRSSWGIVGTSLCGQPLPALLTLAHSGEGMLLAELRAGCCPWQISRMAQGVEWGQPRQGPWGQRMAGSQSQLGWRKDCSGSEGLAPPFFWGEAGFV